MNIPNNEVLNLLYKRIQQVAAGQLEMVDTTEIEIFAGINKGNCGSNPGIEGEATIIKGRKTYTGITHDALVFKGSNFIEVIFFNKEENCFEKYTTNNGKNYVDITIK